MDKNTSCAAAVPLQYNVAYKQTARVYDALTRYFTFSAPLESQWSITVTSDDGSTMNTGAYRLVVASNCDDPTSIVYDTDDEAYPTGACNSGPRSWVTPTIPAGAYSIAISGIDPGLQLSVKVERHF